MKKALKALKTAVLVYLLVSLLLSALVSFGLARWPIILHRVPFLLVDIAVSRVHSIRSDGVPDGIDQHGEYIAFDDNLAIGTHAVSVFLWNPFTNWCDDILFRYDFTR